MVPTHGARMLSSSSSPPIERSTAKGRTRSGSPKSEAAAWPRLRLHSEARKYFDPYAGIDLIASFMESIAAGKELLFALGAGLYLLWNYWRRRKAREAELLRDAIVDDLVRIVLKQISAL